MAPLTQGHTFVLLDYHEFGGTVCPESQPQPSKFPLIAANCSQQPQQTGSVSTVCHSDSCAEQGEHSQPGSGLLPLPTQQVEHAQPVSGLFPTPRVRRHSLACARKDFGTPRLLPEWKRLGSIHLEVNSYSQGFVLSFEQFTSCALE